MKIRTVLFDVDGVLTDGRIWIGAQGESIKAFHAKDGVAVALLQQQGIITGVVSGKTSGALDFRIKQLGFDVAITGCKDKLTAVRQLAEKRGLELDSLAYVGDDIIDIALMKQSARAYAPADAHPLAQAAAHHICKSKGGEGVAREVAEHILVEQGMDLSTMYQQLIAPEQ